MKVYQGNESELRATGLRAAAIDAISEPMESHQTSEARHATKNEYAKYLLRRGLSVPAPLLLASSPASSLAWPILHGLRLPTRSVRSIQHWPGVADTHEVEPLTFTIHDRPSSKVDSDFRSEFEAGSARSGDQPAKASMWLRRAEVHHSNEE
ncbi:hypothetical protein CBOM_05684 [Ceraceosorus bombacis]|uniref:Uncharacterized protein n=1 Tax=Ceraceosorus bombacis TaxID=401625 RepID=A0A0P1BR84_9BASI|nr:hypothetical protein CBOM_05684 [Ceraceosorus bombacis]